MKTIYIKLLVTTFLASTLLSCQEKEFAYHDEYTSDKEEDVYRIVQNDLITPSFRIVELAEVFSGYQEIRSERERALNYVASFFDTRYYIYYEYMQISAWGRIDLLDDGTFKAKPEHSRYFWIAGNTPREVMIENPSAHCFSTSSISETALWNIEAEVKDDVIKTSDLNTLMTSDTFGMAKTETLEPLEMPMCSKGMQKQEPVAGKVKITYRSEYADKSFEVEFHENGKTFILPDGTTREVEPEKTYRWYEY